MDEQNSERTITGTNHPIHTRLSSEPADIGKEIEDGIISNDHWFICSSYGGLELGEKLCVPSFKAALSDQKSRSEGRIRWLTSFDKEGISLVRFYESIGIKIRHLKSAPLMQFGVGNKKVIGTTEEYSGGKMFTTALLSSEPNYVKHYNMLFEGLWKGAVDAEDRIKEIEEGKEIERTEVISDPSEIKEHYFQLARSASSEILLLLPSVNAYLGEQRIGWFDVIKELAQKDQVKVRIILPSDAQLSHLADELESSSNNIKLHRLEPVIDPAREGIKITLMVVDGRASIAFELKDEPDLDFTKLVRLGIWSTSKPLVSTYISIFERLWHQVDLNEKLKAQDKMQEEFINIAAHELRTPTQAIMGYIEALENDAIPSTPDDLKAIARNALRLQRLTEDILDVTKIEGGKLTLKYQKFSVDKVIQSVIEDAENLQSNGNVKLVYVPKGIVIEADRDRISQVVYNLIANAIKFTKQGTVTVTTSSAQTLDNGESRGNMILEVSDTGMGIDADIFPRLFSKFATKSEKGTGLGLFIANSIVDAHRGTITAKNNENGIGATFTVRLPLLSNPLNSKSISDAKVYH